MRARRRRASVFLHSCQNLVTGIRLVGTVPEAAGEVFHLVGPQDDTFLAFQKISPVSSTRKHFLFDPSAVDEDDWLKDRFQSITGQNQPFGMDKVVKRWLPHGWQASKAEDILGYRGKIDLQQGVIDMVGFSRTKVDLGSKGDRHSVIRKQYWKIVKRKVFRAQSSYVVV